MQSSIDKKAGVLDLKKLQSFVDEINVYQIQLLKDVEAIKSFDLFLGDKGR